MTSDKSRIEKIIDQINAVNAKKIALILVIGFICYHGILHEQTPVNGYCLMDDIKETKSGNHTVVCYIVTPRLILESVYDT
ncbi:hypothetical protein BDFB_007155 [Asbolus verrucosus]|uniref:Uncharacterized protein n=1 Tax=Asbolus verrucosus TaxID=1661398 RepID=A0A482W3S7_ASBVE|nr:hypothetical protein BDFB_007155 [Asbolus verrucosus]